MQRVLAQAVHGGVQGAAARGVPLEARQEAAGALVQRRARHGAVAAALQAAAHGVARPPELAQAGAHQTRLGQAGAARRLPRMPVGGVQDSKHRAGTCRFVHIHSRLLWLYLYLIETSSAVYCMRCTGVLCTKPKPRLRKIKKC